MPMMRSVEPTSGKIGDVLVIEGENLGQDSVAALYVTDGKTDIKVPSSNSRPHPSSSEFRQRRSQVVSR